MWIGELIKELSEEFKASGRLAEWILFNLAATVLAILITDPFKAFWQ